QFQSNSFSFVGGTPLFARFFMGGEETIRGYNIRGIAPTAPVRTSFSTKDVFVTDETGRRLRVRPVSEGTSNTVAPSVIKRFTFTDMENPNVREVPTFIGGDTQALFNVEYRIPIFGPLAFAPFFDIGSVFNLRDLEDQFIQSEFVPNSLLGSVVLNPRGQVATRREIKQARTPENPGFLPPGFRFVSVRGEQQVTRIISLDEAVGGVFDNYRYSLGGELRVQVPVINVPFRLIFAWNPNAKADNPFFFEEKRAIRFSVGRTF
ncbi:MAG TPA: BamA/TamA family outer membrane protein, partial [Blastocatellia bacterium]|nr:BamA/TamA family outer membrane protein [Blastocatellia bacterium]